MPLPGETVTSMAEPASARTRPAGPVIVPAGPVPPVVVRADLQSERREQRGGLVGRLADQRRHRAQRLRQGALVAGEVGLLQPEDARVAGRPAADAGGGVVDAEVACIRGVGEHRDEVVGAAVV